MTRIPNTNRSNRTWFCGIAMGAISTLAACGGPVPMEGETGGASGSHGSVGAGGISLSTNGSGSGGGATGTGSGGGSTCPNSVQALVRDFRGWDSSASDPGGAATKHPDFEPAVKTAEKGIAASTLGSDQRPVFGNTPGILTETTAELAVALTFAAARRVVEADRFVSEGRFTGWLPSAWRHHDAVGR